jgi:hypothetical protein
VSSSPRAHAAWLRRVATLRGLVGLSLLWHGTSAISASHLPPLRASETDGIRPRGGGKTRAARLAFAPRW